MSMAWFRDCCSSSRSPWAQGLKTQGLKTHGGTMRPKRDSPRSAKGGQREGPRRGPRKRPKKGAREVSPGGMKGEEGLSQ